MHGEPNIMDSCYSRPRALIHSLTGGQSLKILSDGTWKRQILWWLEEDNVIRTSMTTTLYTH